MAGARTLWLEPMGLKTAFADFKGIGHGITGMLFLEFFHYREPCGGVCSDTMLKAFFKMSRCRLT